MAKAIQKTNHHERFALTTLKIIPNGSPKLIIFAFMNLKHQVKNVI
ncbi:MAG: hypothetical protein ACRBB5_06740 [Nitrosopumilus sp.]